MQPIGSVYWSNRWWLSYGVEIGVMRASSSTWCRYYRSSSRIMCRSITSLLIKRTMSISLSSIGKSRQLYGMVNRFLGSWQRRISMIYRQLVSRTSIQCGHFQLPLSTNVGNRWHSEWLHGIYLLMQRKARARKPCRVNLPSQRSRLVMSFKR